MSENTATPHVRAALSGPAALALAIVAGYRPDSFSAEIEAALRRLGADGRSGESPAQD